jgi:membrane-associated PAP2 superfamily phosphatase
MPALPAHDRSDHLFATATALAALLAWDATALDMALARTMANPHGFPLRDHWLLAQVLHDDARLAAKVLATALCLGVWWPLGPLRRLDLQHRLQLAVTTLCAAFAVSAIKALSASSCPWDLQAFGGVARYASHWSSLPDGGSGHCFPAGHASTGFAFIGGYFAFRQAAPRTANWWLIGSLVAGLAFGLVQQLRGAHFMSHVFWTAFVCWAVALVIDAAAGRWRLANE